MTPQPNQAIASRETPARTTRFAQRRRLPLRRAQAAETRSPRARKPSGQASGGVRLPKPEGGGGSDDDEVAVTVAVADAPPEGVIEPGEIVQVPASTVVLQVRVTASVKSSEDVSVSVKVADCPAEIEATAGLSVSAKSVPVPDSATFCSAEDAPAALSVMVRVPFAGPDAIGVNTTPMVQF